MPATCYRCVSLPRDTVEEPFGVCTSCSSLACQSCGNRLPRAAIFRCVICYPETVLLPSGGLGGEEPPSGSGPGGGQPSGTRGGLEVALFQSTQEFEIEEPMLAEASASDREFFHQGALDPLLERTRMYALDEARREDINAEVGWEVLDDEEETRRRREALLGAKLLARGIETAEAHDKLRKDLLADAFGVACWAIGIRAGSAVPVDERRLTLIADIRLRFAIGHGMPVATPA